MQSIEKKDGRNEEDNKNVEGEGNERYGGRGGGGGEVVGMEVWTPLSSH